MERLEEIQARCKALADKLLYFVAGGYTTQDTLRSLCKDAAFGIGDLQREIACRDAEIEKLTAFVQNGQSAIDTNKRLVEEVGSLKDRVFELEDCVIDMLGQFAYEGTNEKYGGETLYTGGLSALENAFSVMNIPDPVKKDDFYGKGWNGTEAHP